MKSSAIIELFQQYVIANYTRYPVCLTRGEGSYIWDAEGTKFILGIDAHPKLVALAEANKPKAKNESMHSL